MRIKNLVAKVIGIGNVRIYPGSDFVDVPDELAYAYVINERGEKTGEIDILPSLRALERLNQIVIVETRKPVESKPVEEPVTEAKPKKSRAKKAE